jgi:hypothetical protein
MLQNNSSNKMDRALTEKRNGQNSSETNRQNTDSKERMDRPLVEKCPDRIKAQRRERERQKQK